MVTTLQAHNGVSVAVAVAVALGAGCRSSPDRDTMPSGMFGPEPAAAAAPAAAPTGPAVASDRGELILRSAGKDIGHERFTIRPDGAWAKVELTAATTFPDPLAIELAMWVDPASWRLDRYDIAIDNSGDRCTARWRHDTGTGIVTLDVEYPDGVRQIVSREPREHAEHFVAIRPTITQTAICARATAGPQQLESFAPWYIVRTAPRAASKVPTADGKRMLDVVKVDELIDVYCDGPRLAIVHYPAHAFIAARTEYDDAAQKLTAADPTDELWASELRCPPRAPAP